MGRHGGAMGGDALPIVSANGGLFAEEEGGEEDGVGVVGVG